MAKKGQMNNSLTIKKPAKKRLTKAEIEQALIDNFIGLQKVLTNLSIKFENLSEQITKLLEIFEISAKSFIEKQETPKEEKELLNKLDILADQNKTIAKGLTLVEEKIRHKMYGENIPNNLNQPQIGEKPRPRNNFL